MNIRKLRVPIDNNLDNFKINLLNALHLFDHKENCLLDFDNRIENYFKRNKMLKVEIEVEKSKLFKTIYDKKFWNLKEYKQEIPKDYPFGASNMETQAYYNPIVCDERYYQNVEKTKDETNRELDSLLLSLEKLNREDNLEIKIKE